MADAKNSFNENDLTGIVGNTLGNYKVESFLGAGSMGAVYKATQISLDRIVALKVLKPGLAADNEFALRFVREARAVAAVSHPNIVQVIDAGTVENIQYMAMEYVDGKTLLDVIDEGQIIGEGEAGHYLRQILAALSAAHAVGIIHRDLKPENILITEAGQIKVSDFGLAKIAKDRNEITMAGALMGTPAYMSPEQVEGRTLCAASDLYSLGALMFHLLTRRTPYPSTNIVEVLYAHVNEQTPSVRELRADISKGLDEMIARFMAKTLEVRYSSALEATGALDVLEGKGGTADLRKQLKIEKPLDTTSKVLNIIGVNDSADDAEIFRNHGDECASKNDYESAVIAWRKSLRYGGIHEETLLKIRDIEKRMRQAKANELIDKANELKVAHKLEEAEKLLVQVCGMLEGDQLQAVQQKIQALSNARKKRSNLANIFLIAVLVLSVIVLIYSKRADIINLYDLQFNKEHTEVITPSQIQCKEWLSQASGCIDEGLIDDARKHLSSVMLSEDGALYKDKIKIISNKIWTSLLSDTQQKIKEKNFIESAILLDKLSSITSGDKAKLKKIESLRKLLK